MNTSAQLTAMDHRNRVNLPLLVAIAAALLAFSGCQQAEVAQPVQPVPRAAPQMGKLVSAAARTPKAQAASNLAKLQAIPAGPAAVAPSKAAAPMQLTGSDGAALELTSLEARAVLDGALAFTEVRLVFRNPQPRQREGRFSLTMPSGAAISRFAMKIHGNWMEGEVVERKRAQQVYEDFLHRRQDPAILEQAAGNTFEARVFPIEALAEKELIVSWSQELADPAAPYVLPLAGLPKLGNLKVTAYLQANPGATAGAAGSLGATLGSVTTLSVNKQDFEPNADFEVYPAFFPSEFDGLRSGNLAMARVAIDAEQAADIPEELLVLFDTSASEVIGFEARLARLQAIAAEAKAKGVQWLGVVAFDQTVLQAYAGDPAGLGPETLGVLRVRGALGASNLGAGLAEVARVLAQRNSGKGVRVVVMTNGVPTAGLREAGQLREKVLELSKVGVDRLDVLTSTTQRDDAIAKGLTMAGLPRTGTVLNLSPTNEDLAPLWRATFGPIDVAVPGAQWVWPKRVEGLQPGQAVLVYADLPAATPMTVRLSGGATGELQAKLRDAPAPLLERAWVAARIALLQDQRATADRDMAEAIQKQIIDLSVKHRVLSAATALLVLETEWEYQRYGIARTALADILTVSPEGAAVRSPRGGVPELGQFAGLERQAQPDAEAAVRPGWAAPAAPEMAAPRREAAAMADKQADPDDTRRQARQQVEQKAVAGAFKGIGASKMFADSGDSEGGDVVAKSFGGTGPGAGGDGAASPGAGSVKLSGSNAGGGTVEKVAAGGKGGFGEREAATAKDEGKDKKEQAVQVRLSSSGVDGVDGGEGGIKAEVGKVISRKNSAVQRCYEVALRDNPDEGGKVKVTFTVGTERVVTEVSVAGASGQFADCIKAKFERIRGLPLLFSPQTFSQSYVFSKGFDERPRFAKPRVPQQPYVPPPPPPAPPPPPPPDPAELAAERYRNLLARIDSADAKAAEAEAHDWHQEAPTDLLALVAWGRAALQAGDAELAARIFGSIIDLYPARTDLRRYAGNLLEAAGPPGFALALDSYRVAVEQRPDHKSGYPMLAMALVRAGKHLEALDVLDTGLRANSRFSQFAIDATYKELMGVIAAAAIAAKPETSDAVVKLLASKQGLVPLAAPSLRFVLSWETDTNDVDFHIRDARGNEASYRQRELASGGLLLGDITNGWGPECFSVEKPAAHPYSLWAHYFRRGPMGFGMGRVQVIRFDGKALQVQERPFVVSRDGEDLQLGTVTAGN